MTATDQAGPAGDWSLRPWLLAALLGIAGLLVWLASDGGSEVPWRMALTAFAFFGPLAVAFTLDRDGPLQPAIFGAIIGLVMAGIAWRATSAGDRYADAEYWVASGVLASLLAVPLFQSGFHRHRWRTSYKDTHFHVWTDAISGAGALAFVGLSWGLLAILAALFDIIRIGLLKDLLDREWFGWVFSGAAFGAALGVLRNQLRIIGTLQGVVLLVLSILAVPLAIALVIFLIAVLLSGIDVLWDATESATPLLLACAVGAFVLANAVVRDDDEDASASPFLRVAGFVLALGILPLAIMAAVSMGTRIDQHGLSPERIWALIAIAVAVAYGVGYFVAAIRGRKDGWRGLLRQANLHLAVLTCGIALLLALPVLNFGAMSTANQLSRLENGKVSAEDFDYAALRWDFGNAGREALARLAKSGDAQVRKLAGQTIEQERRPYRFGTQMQTTDRLKNLRMEFADERLRERTRSYVRSEPWICDKACVALDLGPGEDGTHRIVVAERRALRQVTLPALDAAGEPIVPTGERAVEINLRGANERPLVRPDSKVELRPFSGQRVYVDGKPLGEPLE